MSTNRALRVFFVVVALLGVGLLCWAIVRLDFPAQKLAINPARDQPPHQIPGAAEEQEPEPPLPQRLIAVLPVPKQKDWPAGRPVVRLGTDLFLHGEPINALTFSRDARF